MQLTVRRLVLAALLAAIASACSTATATPRTTLPPPNAEPAEVVANYLQALVDGDCGKAAALTTARGLTGSRPWCDRPRVTGYSELSRNDADPGTTERVYAVQLTTRGGDVSLPDGDHTMFVQVLLQPGGVWRVNGVGSGP
jgi:hypothetical protein